MYPYLIGLEGVLKQLQWHVYLEHPPRSRVWMREDLAYDLVRAEELRPTLAPADSKRLDAEVGQARDLLAQLELIEHGAPAFRPASNPHTKH